MTTPDGGQAFPVLECSMNNVTGEMQTFQSSPGLSIRDYFAAQVMGHLAAGDNGTYYDNAVTAYKCADEMLSVRVK
jgi:hypothetical protein